MHYSVKQLAELSGVSARTLRFYDQIGLLKPARNQANGYRVYTSEQLDLLFQILLYREFGLPLAVIKDIVLSESFDQTKALEEHLEQLKLQQIKTKQLIASVEAAIKARKGELVMNDEKRFEAFKKDQIAQNEQKYGQEIRQKYGDDAVNKSNAKYGGMTKAQLEKSQKLADEINELLAAAMHGDPKSSDAKKLCRMHEEWLKMFWADGQYSKQAHLALGEMYVSDERFKAYYDALGDGAAQFLYDALKEYCK